MVSGDIPGSRLSRPNDAPLDTGGRYVLYWMIACRRTRWSFALQRAVQWCRDLGRPLVVLEALRAGYDWASDRHHRFILEGMRDNAAAFGGSGVRYHPYVEPEAGAGSGLLEALASDACVVITDDFPCFFLPRMVEAAARRVPVAMERIDGCGLLPLRAADRVYPTAHAFRRFLHRTLAEHLASPPAADPLALLAEERPARLPDAVADRWPAMPLDNMDRLVARLPIDHSVPPVRDSGGSVRGARRVERFVRDKLASYDERRNQPEEDATSGLSPYLHYGHVSPHEVVHRIAAAEDWSPLSLDPGAGGSRTGYWGMSASAEAFLDQLVTWRELGFNMSSRQDDFDRYESLPGWARATLEQHAADPREHLHTLEQFDAADTHDPLWNAAQIQLRREGTIHNYLRMLWGKKILHWSESPRAALDIMIELNNRYALDGRDPNSYSGIFWTLGRYDRAWGPERPVFGKVRYMTSANTARKFRVKEYVARHSS